MSNTVRSSPLGRVAYAAISPRLLIVATFLSRSPSVGDMRVFKSTMPSSGSHRNARREGRSLKSQVPEDVPMTCLCELIPKGRLHSSGPNALRSVIRPRAHRVAWITLSLLGMVTHPTASPSAFNEPAKPKVPPPVPKSLSLPSSHRNG